jgi:hypothetical protein
MLTRNGTKQKPGCESRALKLIELWSRPENRYTLLGIMR